MRGDDESREIVIISDNTGGTASRLVNAILVQYAGAGVEYSIGRVFSNIRTRKQVRDALGNIGDESFVIYTIITGGCGIICRVILTGGTSSVLTRWVR